MELARPDGRDGAGGDQGDHAGTESAQYELVRERREPIENDSRS